MFLSQQVFKYEIDFTNSVEERYAMITIANSLIPFGLVTPKDVIDNYCNQNFNHRKEIVILEWFIRDYPNMREYVFLNKELNVMFDNVFLQDLVDEDFSSKLVDLEYMDDYHQIKDNLAPLNETTKELRNIDEDALYDDYVREIKEQHSLSKTLSNGGNEIKGYKDIEDEKIKILFNNLLNKPNSDILKE